MNIPAVTRASMKLKTVYKFEKDGVGFPLRFNNESIHSSTNQVAEPPGDPYF